MIVRDPICAREIDLAALTAFGAPWVALPALAQGDEGPGRYWHDDWGWGHMLSGSLMMIIFWGGLILLLVLGIRWLGGASGGAAPRKSSLETLEQRFARGEIDKEEFEERKRLLSD